jgi:L-iditol 2-dehydrogenase
MREFCPLPQTSVRAVLHRHGAFRLEDGPLPRPGPGDLLFRLLAAGLSAEDVSADRFLNRTPPARPVGEIAAAGDEVTGWNPLDRALLLPATEGTALDGLADYFLVPAAQVKSGLLHRLPLDLPADDATLLPAAALATRALREARLGEIQSLLVIGLGLAGQIALRLARHQGLRAVYAADRSPTLRQRAEYSGATQVIRVQEVSLREELSRATGVEGVVVLSPDAALAHDALQSLARGGSMVIGAPFSSSFLFALPGARLQRQELRIQGVGSFGAADLRAAHQALKQGIVNAETLVSKRVPWKDMASLEIAPDYWEHGTHVVVEGPSDE